MQPGGQGALQVRQSVAQSFGRKLARRGDSFIRRIRGGHGLTVIMQDCKARNDACRRRSETHVHHCGLNRHRVAGVSGDRHVEQLERVGRFDMPSAEGAARNEGPWGCRPSY